MKVTENIKNKISKLEVKGKGYVSFAVVGTNAFSGNGLNYFKSSEFPEGSSNYGYRSNIILDDEYVPLVDAACKLVAAELKTAHRDAVIDDGKWIHNPSKLCFLRGNKNTYGEDDDKQVYDGFADKWFLKTNRKDSLKAPRVFNAATREELKAVVMEDGRVKLPDGVKADGSKANFYITIYPNTEFGTISCSISRVAYRADAFKPLGGEQIDEEDEESLFEDPEANSFGENEEEVDFE